MDPNTSSTTTKTSETDLPLGPFSYIRVTDPNSDKAQVMDKWRRLFYELWVQVQTTEELDPRYRALTMTALEQASLWLQRGLALGYDD